MKRDCKYCLDADDCTTKPEDVKLGLPCFHPEIHITFPVTEVRKIISALDVGLENTDEALSAHLNYYAPYCATKKAERLTKAYEDQRKTINEALEYLKDYREAK